MFGNDILLCNAISEIILKFDKKVNNINVYLKICECFASATHGHWTKKSSELESVFRKLRLEPAECLRKRMTWCEKIGSVQVRERERERERGRERGREV